MLPCYIYCQFSSHYIQGACSLVSRESQSSGWIHGAVFCCDHMCHLQHLLNTRCVRPALYLLNYTAIGSVMQVHFRWVRRESVCVCLNLTTSSLLGKLLYTAVEWLRKGTRIVFSDARFRSLQDWIVQNSSRVRVKSKRSPVETHETLEGLCLLADLGKFRNPPGRAGASGRGQGKCEHDCLDRCPGDPTSDKREKMEG